MATCYAPSDRNSAMRRLHDTGPILASRRDMIDRNRLDAPNPEHAARGGLFAVYNIDERHFALVGPSGHRVVVARDEIRRVVFQRPKM